MTYLLLTYKTQLTTTDGRVYTVVARGRERPDGTWEGWLEFVPDDGSEILRSGRETTQPDLADLEYWATGLTPVYLEGAMQRALEAASAAPADADRVAAEPVAVSEAPVSEPVLNPFSVYAKGEDLLRKQLAALSPRHLRAIARAYDLAPADADLEVLTAPELIALIVVAVRRLAA
jgi:hypothetical protein